MKYEHILSSSFNSFVKNYDECSYILSFLILLSLYYYYRYCYNYVEILSDPPGAPRPVYYTQGPPNGQASPLQSAVTPTQQSPATMMYMPPPGGPQPRVAPPGAFYGAQPQGNIPVYNNQPQQQSAIGNYR